MRNRTTGWLALAGGMGGLATWLISEPFVRTADKGIHTDGVAFTLGSFYGWFAHFMLGALIGGFLAIVMTLPRAGARRALLGGLIAAAIGGPLACAADALSDWIGIQMTSGSSSPIGAALLPAVVWHLVVATVIALSVALASYPTVRRLRRAIGAGLVAAIVSYFARDLLGVVDASRHLMNIDFSKVDPQNPQSVLQSIDAATVWVPWSTERLGSHVMMGLVIGLALGVSDAVGRAAWLRRDLGRREGYDYPLYAGPNRIGSAEGLEVSIRNEPGIAPVHAILQPHQGHWMVSDLSGQGFGVNGFGTQSAYLREGDVVQFGNATLRFCLRGSPKNSPAPAPMPVPIPIAINVPDVEARPKWEPRLIDPFGQVHPIAVGATILGRGADAQIRFDHDGAVSRRHAALSVSPGAAVIAPLADGNPTEVNGLRIHAETHLTDGDKVKIGATILTFRA